MFSVIFQYQFIQNAIIASLFASVVCGIIGVIIVEKKMLMMGGGIAHTALGGVGLGYFLGFEPIFGAVGFSVLAALGIGVVRKKGGASSDVAIALFWSLGMALGIIFIALTPGYPPDINSYLFGNILSVARVDLYLTLVMTIIVLTLIIVFYHDWEAWLFDEEFAAVAGIAVTFLEFTMLVLVALTVVTLIRVVGIIMVIALLSAPAATAAFFTKKLKARMVLAVLFALVSCLGGLWISYAWNIATGAVIIICCISFYIISFFIQRIMKENL
ncbi:MAG TPA: metal ABC transporter permease [Treponemataceae bacterium]|nr:metal ABC transporter permease [Treponemataceae bacterium]